MSIVIILTLCLGHICLCGGHLENIALGKMAYQTDTYGSMVEADKAIDGELSQNFLQWPCTHTTTGTDRFWEVDLGLTYYIDHVTIYNRVDCCSERLRDVELLIGKTEASYTLQGYHEGTIDSIYTFQLKKPTAGKWVRITRRSTVVDYLTLCEVQVFGRLYRYIDTNYSAKHGQKGTGTAIKTLTRRTMTECGYMCLITYECEAVNFLEDKHVCELLSSKTTEPAAQNTAVLI